MIVIYQCGFCVHFQGSHVVDDPSMPKGWRLLDHCAAFPEGIPRDIIESRFDHRNAYPGDNDIGFSPKDATADRLQALCFALPVVVNPAPFAPDKT